MRTKGITSTERFLRPSPWLPLAGAIAVAVSIALVFPGPTAFAAGKATTHTVVIEGTKFEPEILNVKVGDIVVWINKDPFAHTATSRGVFDSHTIAANKSWKYTARKRGDYAYICSLHTTMKATLKVE